MLRRMVAATWWDSLLAAVSQVGDWEVRAIVFHFSNSQWDEHLKWKEQAKYTYNQIFLRPTVLTCWCAINKSKDYFYDDPFKLLNAVNWTGSPEINLTNIYLHHKQNYTSCIHMWVSWGSWKVYILFNIQPISQFHNLDFVKHSKYEGIIWFIITKFAAVCTMWSTLDNWLWFF